ncbi:DUF4269 domain-containing protein [Spirosoma sp. HMF3257]|uniref:DUF4269 domain-containing protein n=1 Tax=Spirosoma telluris TaxID=2183553 RepID=A0A327NF58_9BACT|nr:DUF4269 domain-containing protein [Spirosoma telluris]RAI73403.1 DUF4269 domain-containing protein [Spirosoma telluris]
MNFSTIDYLKEGTPRQREAYWVLTEHNVLVRLEPFTPMLVGTIPINIDIDTSDLDIICYWTDRQAFIAVVLDCFGKEKAFTIRESSATGRDVVVANFWLDGFEIELFGQNIPTHQQMAYRHMLIEHKLLIERGETFRQQVIALKRAGLKTEPAFGKLLCLEGNPYVALLAYENA